MERVKGIEPSSSAWKAAALPLSYTRPIMMTTPQKLERFLCTVLFPKVGIPEHMFGTGVVVVEEVVEEVVVKKKGKKKKGSKKKGKKGKKKGTKKGSKKKKKKK